MRKSRFSDQQIALALQQIEHGLPVADFCRKLGVAEQIFYRWKKKFGEMAPSEIKKLKQLEEENRHIESFNGRLRDECLNAKWFESLDDACKALLDWRRDYNEVRPHSSLGDMPPSAFAARIQGLQPNPCS